MSGRSSAIRFWLVTIFSEQLAIGGEYADHVF